MSYHFYCALASVFGVGGVYGARLVMCDHLAINWIASLSEGFYIYDNMAEPLPREYFKNTEIGTQVATNPGLLLADKSLWLSAEETTMMTEEISKWIKTWGMVMHPRRAAVVAEDLENAPVKVGNFTQSQFLSDFPEDSRASKAPWGSGDSLDLAQLPAEARSITRRIQNLYPEVGKLRHIYLESTEGTQNQLYRRPIPAHPFSGHEYFVIPMSGDLTATFSPSGRSRVTQQNLCQRGWTSRDIDVFLPEGSILRVFSRARFDWGLGIRPTDSPRLEEGSKTKKSYMMLHFEGPSVTFSKRSKTLYPEYFAYGPSPSYGDYDAWSDVNQLSAAAVFRQTWQNRVLEELRNAFAA